MVDKALVAGEPVRHIAQRVPFSPTALQRHKRHAGIGRAIERVKRRHETAVERQTNHV
jgi:hypothetical protein